MMKAGSGSISAPDAFGAPSTAPHHISVIKMLFMELKNQLTPATT
jgi:hypothetical protein